MTQICKEAHHEISSPKEIIIKAYPDKRGFFLESWNKMEMEKLGIANNWVQDNHSFSYKGTIRGLHYQLDGQAKLVRCLSGSVLDIFLDLRKESKTFGKWGSCILSQSASKMLYIPPRFAHGFIALEDAHLTYKVDTPYNPSLDKGINVADPFLAIDLKFAACERIISDKDLNLPLFVDADLNFP